MTIILIVELFKKKVKEIFNNWIIASGIIGSVVTLAAGVAYTNLVKIQLSHSFYLMSAYILNNVFSIICIFTLVSYIVRIYNNRKNNKLKEVNEK